jgi:dipeptidyl aminopeptidase/acylaminoacyl peptidase
MRHVRTLAAAALVTALGFGLASCNRTEPHQTYTAAQFYETTSFSLGSGAGYVFSSDNSNILISSDATGVYNAYAQPAAGGDPTALTSSTTNATYAVTYFPNDDRALYTADGGGDELNHVFLRTPDGQSQDLTPGERVKAAFVGWRADGAVFYVTTNERNPQAFDVYAYDATTYARTLHYTNTNGYHVRGISDDGRYIALVQDISSADNNIHLVDLNATGAARQRLITQHTGNIEHGVYTFTPDNTALVYSTNEHGEFSQAWTYTLATGAKAVLIQADWDVQNVSYSRSGRYRVSSVNADASTQLTITDTQSNAPVTIAGLPEGDITQVRFNRDETQVAVLVASDTSPANVFVADLAGGEARRLTNALNPAIAENMLVTASVARFASYDGLEVPGILYRPREASATNKVPAIVLVHGGPGGQSRRGYSAQIQHLVNHGYAVYAINNRGSSGYGKTFYHLDDRRHGDVDLQDVVASRAFLASQDWIDGEKVAIMGGSYGGYMVAAALAFQPDAFNVGINLFGVTNWTRTLTSVPPWWAAQRQSLFDELGDPATDTERLNRISPLFHASNITKPLLVVQGANDPRVLQVESDELVAAVRANNVPVEYIVFPDEGHGFQRRENRITASEAYLAFLNQHLKGEAPAAAPAG